MSSTRPSNSPNPRSRPTDARTGRSRTGVRPGSVTFPLAAAAAVAAVGVAVAGVLGTAPSAQASPGQALSRSLAQALGAQHSDPSACHGEGVDNTAVIRYESDVVIDAPLSTIWKLQTDVERWPSWQPPVLTSERLDPGPFRKGSRFRWTTPAPATPSTPATTLEVTSTVRQVQRQSCILWSGPAIGEGLRIDEGVHLWTFTKVRGGVRVHTEETWTGAQVEADVPTATAALGGGLEAWLRDLKTTAERRR
ncbi:SRPBCC family protein [Streptomyces sp. NBC_00878]|uniref:SRPBCC family protein n=1 Tax=Streptomyces sp. NBC_00878 TaxID=2975854 RepID=UPI002255FDA9|nr:SRPBCC family protein [Streptomyces sp. NBC_00878]MCX4906398.1 SRPBCC family protein [Streptomyces sp. NBC_00878]